MVINLTDEARYFCINNRMALQIFDERKLKQHQKSLHLPGKLEGLSNSIWINQIEGKTFRQRD